MTTVNFMKNFLIAVTLSLTASVVNSAFPDIPSWQTIFSTSENGTLPVVNAGRGRYRGVHREKYGTILFGGIPYADSVSETARLNIPKEPRVTLEEVDTSSPGSFCIQSWAPFTFALRPTLPPRPDFPGDPAMYFSGSGSEDCLTLDVYVPQSAKQGDKLPVQVFIPGGGYAITPTLNEPDTYIAKNDYGFIAVFPRYRLGAYGLLGGSEMLAANLTNLAMRDIIAAMTWVKHNIENFGGDPKHVVMEGASAGAAAVMYLAQSEKFFHNGEPLWHGMIGNLVYSPPLLRCDDPLMQAQFDRFSRSVGCSQADNKIECLRNVPSQRYLEANYEILSTSLYGVLPFNPCVDGEWISESPNALNQNHSARKSIKLLAGSHVRSAVPFVPSPPNFPTASNDVMTSWLRLYIPTLPESSLGTILAAYDPAEYERKENSGYERFLDLYSDVMYNCPTYWWTEAYEDQAWKFLYAVPPGFDSADLQWFTTNGPYTPNAPDFLEDFLRSKGSFIRTLDVNADRTSRMPEWGPFQNAEAPREELIFNLDAWGASMPVMRAVAGQKERCDVWRKFTRQVPY